MHVILDHSCMHRCFAGMLFSVLLTSFITLLTPRNCLHILNMAGLSPLEDNDWNSLNPDLKYPNLVRAQCHETAYATSVYNYIALTVDRTGTWYNPPQIIDAWDQGVVFLP